MSEQTKMVFSLLVGILYLLAGVGEILVSVLPDIGIPEIFQIPGDLIGGLVLILVGLVLLFGARELSLGTHEGVAYMHVGIALAGIFGMVAFLSLSAEFVTLAIFEGEPVSFGLFSAEITPQIYLAPIALYGFIIWGKEFSGGLLRD